MLFRRTLAVLAACVSTTLAGASLPGAAALAQGVVPLDAYAQLPEIQSVSISPSGDRLAMIAGEDRTEMHVIVLSLEGGDPFALAAFAGDIDDRLLFSVDWASDNHLVLVYRERRLLDGSERGDVGRQVIYDLRSNEYSEFERAGSQIVHLLPDEPNTVLLSTPVVEVRTSANSFTAARGRGDVVNTPVNLYRYDLNRGDYSLVANGSVDTVNWVVDESGAPLLRQDRIDDTRTWRVFAREGRSWTQIYEERFSRERFGRDGFRAISSMSGLVAEDVNGRGVWFAQLADRDKLQGWLFDPETGEISNAAAPDGFDISSFVVDWRTDKVIGVRWLAERRQVEWFDSRFAALQRQLNGLFEGSDVVISDWDLSGNRILVRVIGGATSEDFYLLDRDSGQLNFLQTVYPDIPQERIHPVEIVSYRAEDGLELFGYLTRPVDRPLADLPMVLLPHGGPQARDGFGFDMWAQPFADMGYAVFQPQFRGSSGQGQDFVRRGHGEWGRKMQSDLTDAVTHLVNQGWVDPDRVCIFGWSYGGYAALAGYALTPEVYRCVIAGAPVSDILEMMAWEGDRQGGASINYWTEYIGDWRTERDEMIAISPARQTASGRVPLLLIHGREDLIVPFEQAEIMYDAARRAGKDVELVAIDGDGHNLLFQRTRLITLQSMTEFLAEHNPPD
ncbi:MAG: S9 family peptidase [Pseudomonadota bacterium]